VAAQQLGHPTATAYSTWPPATAQVASNQGAAAQRTAYQPPAGMPGGAPTDEVQGYQIQLEPPGLERLQMSLQSEESLKERIRQENRQRVPMERVIFPEEPILSREVYYGRGPIWPERQEVAIPYFVCYKRLYFEEKNSERYGWDLGLLQPLISAGAFYADVVTLPYHMATDPCRCYECSAGYCLPGDPVPCLL
jgi:hypothetical protein